VSVLRSLYQGTRAVQSAVKDVNRLREIATVLARYGFGALFERVNLGLPIKRSEPVSPAPVEQRIVDALQELGPTFVKFGQIMSTRPDILPEPLCQELKRLQDRVGTETYEKIAEQITRELKAPPEEVFAHFDREPLASASIAQVHAATTQAGDDVIVKVRRPGIGRTVESDLSIMHMLARRIEEMVPETRLFNLTGMVTQFERSMARETDFTLEASSIDQFGRNFADTPEVHIPRVFVDLSTRAVLTMERIRGVKLTELDHEEVDVEEVACRYLDAAYKMIFQHGLFHGDLHPGNIFLEDDGRLALIDFGMVGRLNGAMRDRIVDVLSALLREDLQDVARTFFELGIPEGPIDYVAFEAEVVEVIERHFVGHTISEIEIGAFFADLVDGAMRYRVRMPADYTMLFKALMTTEGLARELAPEVNPVELARPFIEELIKQRYSPDRLRRSALVTATRMASFLNTAVVSGQRIIRTLETGETRLHLETPAVTEALHRIAGARERQNLLLIAGLCVALAFLVNSSEKALLFGLSLPALALVGGAATAATLSLIGMCRGARRQGEL